MHRKLGVSLVEIILALVILGLLAALAVPRFSSAATPADDGAVLREHLKVMRVAIERYYQDHGAYPGAGAAPEAVVAQLTRYTDQSGSVSDVRGARYCFGPYLRGGLPPCPVPPHIGHNGLGIVGEGHQATTSDATDSGWLYDPQTGRVWANSDALDEESRCYATY